MITRRLFWLLVSTVVAVPSVSGADDNQELTQFEGKVVTFEVDKSTTLEQDSDSVTLLDPRVLSIGGKAFIYGQVYVPTWWEEEKGATPKRFRGVAVERVFSLYVFDPDDFDEYARKRWSERDND